MKASRTTVLPTVPMAERDHLQGTMAAPIQLLEHGDFECPFCGEAHPHAQHAAEAAEAAGAQGRFWEMHDILFENQDALDDEDLAHYAEVLGLNARRLLAEVRDGVHQWERCA